MNMTLVRRLLLREWLWLALVFPLIIAARPAFSPILLLLPYLWIVRKANTGRFVPATPLNVSILCLLLMVFVSLYATADLAFSFPKIAGIIFGIAVFFAVEASTVGGERALWSGVSLYMAFGPAVVILSLLGTEWSPEVRALLPAIQRLPGPLLRQPNSEFGFNPNEVAGVLLWIAPLALVLALGLIAAIGSGRSGQFFERLPAATGWFLRITLPVVALLTSATLLFSQSRAALAGLACAFFFVALVAAQRRRALVALIVVAIVAAAMVAGIGSDRVSSALFSQLSIAYGTPSDAMNSLEGRQEIWTRALYAIQDFPLTGLGMNMFRRAVPVLYPLFIIGPGVDIAHAHNHFLQVALDLGFPGLVAYVAIWFGATLMLWRTWRQTMQFRLRALTLGIAASLLAYAVYGLLDTVALGARPGFIFWYLLGLVAGAYRLVVAESTPGRDVARQG